MLSPRPGLAVPGALTPVTSEGPASAPLVSGGSVGGSVMGSVAGLYQVLQLVPWWFPWWAPWRVLYQVLWWVSVVVFVAGSVASSRGLLIPRIPGGARRAWMS